MQKKRDRCFGRPDKEDTKVGTDIGNEVEEELGGFYNYREERDPVVY